jgi:hypothetical protein
MHGHHETGKPQAIRGIRAIRGGRAAFGLWFGLFGSRMLVAQNEPAKTANQAVFTQQPARPRNRSRNLTAGNIRSLKMSAARISGIRMDNRRLPSPNLPPECSRALSNSLLPEKPCRSYRMRSLIPRKPCSNWLMRSLSPHKGCSKWMTKSSGERLLSKNPPVSASEGSPEPTIGLISASTIFGLTRGHYFARRASRLP